MPRLLVAAVLCLVSGACASRQHAPAATATTAVETPAALAAFSRVWVAGFAASSNEFDLNAETVRLLRAEFRMLPSVVVVEAARVGRDAADFIFRNGLRVSPVCRHGCREQDAREQGRASKQAIKHESHDAPCVRCREHMPSRWTSELA